MRLTNVFGGRPALYDRNPTSFAFETSQTTGPHVQTTRGTYTVPTARKAQVTSISGCEVRVTAATTAARSETDHNMENVATALAPLARLAVWTNAVGDKDHYNQGGANYLLAGEIVIYEDVDSSTGGTIEYLSGMWINEFDA